MENIGGNYNRKTIFCDIDGTIVTHHKPNVTFTENHEMTLLPGVVEKFLEWEKLGYCIVLVTARKECMRKVTEKQLSNIGIFYDQLIMNVGSGPRYLINDTKPDGLKTAHAINIERDQGLSGIKI